MLKFLSWKYAVDWGSLIMLCCVYALQQILMSVQPGKTTAQRTRCASTHMAVSSVSVLTAPKSQTLHTSRHHPCKHRPQSSFYIHVFISVAFDLRCTALRKWGHSAIFLKKKMFWLISTKFPTVLCFAQALWTKPLSIGQQGVLTDTQFFLLPLPGSGVQPVCSSGHVPGLGVAPDRWHASLLPPRRKARTPPLHCAAFWPCDRAADAGEPRAGPCHAGGRGGDERAGEASPDREVHHQSHHVCFPVWVLGWDEWRMMYVLKLDRWTEVLVRCCVNNHGCATIFMHLYHLMLYFHCPVYMCMCVYVYIYIHAYMYIFLWHRHTQ